MKTKLENIITLKQAQKTSKELRNHKWAGHMDSTLELLHSYTFSKLVDYRLLFFLLFFFLLSLSLFVFLKFVRPSMLGF